MTKGTSLSFLCLLVNRFYTELGRKSGGGVWGVRGGVSQQNKVRYLLGRVAAGKALWVWRVEQLLVRGPLSCPL